MINFSQLAVGYNREIISGLEGEIQRGQIIALMGINGIGKSCFLKTLSGLMPPIKGEYVLNGKKLQEYSMLELAKLISVVLTDKIDIDYLLVSEFIALGRTPYTNNWGIANIDDKKIIAEAIKLLGLDDLKEKYFSTLSDGQKQKVLLARALVQSPEYMFLDEPTTFLDLPSKIELMNLFKKISRDKHIAIFFSTHDIELIKSSVDQIWLIDNQGYLHRNSPEKMISTGLFLKNFGLNLN